MFTGPYLATVHWFKGQQRQQAVTSEDTEHYDLEARYDVTQRHVPHTFLQGGLIILEWKVQLIQMKTDNTTFTLWRYPTHIMHVL